MNEINLEKLKDLSSKMNLRFIDINKKDTYVSKSLDISKPNRPEVKKFFQDNWRLLQG